MSTRSLSKDFIREVRKTLPRFFSILLIAMLGVAFLSGLLVTAPDMRATADLEHDEYGLMDIRVASTLGFSASDPDALRGLADVADVQPGYSATVYSTIGENAHVSIVHSIPTDPRENRLELVSGRMPENEGECVYIVTGTRLLQPSEMPIGQTVRMSLDEGEDLSEYLSRDTFTITGVARSPMYIYGLNFGHASLGNGTVTAAFAVPEAAFAYEVYTDLYVRSDDARGVSAYDSRYADAVDALMDRIEAVEPERAALRYDEVVSKANEELDDARSELADGERERDEKLADAHKKIADARVELSDGEQRLEEETNDFLRKIADGEKKIRDGQRELDSARVEVAQNQKKLADGEKQLAEGRRQLADGRAQLEAQRAPLDEGRAQLEELEGAIAAIESQLPPEALAGAAQGERNAANADEGRVPDVRAVRDPSDAPGTNGLLPLIDEQTAESSPNDDDGGEAVPDANSASAQTAVSPSVETASAESALAQLAALRAQRDAASAQISEGESAYAAAKAELDAAQRELDARQKELDAGRTALAEAQTLIKTNQRKLDDARKELADGKREGEEKIADAQRQIDDAKIELADGERELTEKTEESGREIADAHAKIDDAQQKIDDLEMPEWYVLDRSSLPNFAEYGSNADRIERISLVFPVIFFLVAALVSLTSMTRMVEEQRGEIGTLKAIGYEPRQIARKYLLYALLSSLLGSAIGAALGMTLLPYIILNAYGMMFHFNNYVYLYTPVIILLSAGTAVGVTVLATWLACRQEVRDVPASLMRPRPPKEGKRVLLERVPFIWKRLSFLQKVTVRNIVRYKSRFFMTLVGIAGCTALLLTGFGLRDSITSMLTRQYPGIDKYKASIMLEKDLASDAVSEIEARALENGAQETLLMSIQPYDIRFGSRTESLMLHVPRDAERISDFYDYHGRKDKQPVPLTDEGIVLVEKLARVLGVTVGDTVELIDGDKRAFSVPVAGIRENYVGYLGTLTAPAYEAASGLKPEYNQMMLLGDALVPEAEDAFSTALLQSDSVVAVTFTSFVRATSQEMVDTLNTVVIVILFSAGLLAFVVLFNLTSINITERERELATIKVLGFYNGEVAGYVVRENAVLTFLGSLLGLVLGIFLHKYVIATVEVNEVMFGQEIFGISYMLALLLTVVFACVVNLVMFPRIRRIDMVTSLKSVE